MTERGGQRGNPGRLGMAGSLKDADLLQALLNKGSLTDMQLGEVVAAATRVAGGVRLTKEARDRWMAVGMAQKLFERTQIKRRPHKGPPMHNPGDPYSTVWTSGTEKANDVLASGRTADGGMIAPPTRRRTG